MNIIEELRSKQSRDNRALLDRAADRIEALEREKAEIFGEAKRVLDALYADIEGRRLQTKDPDAQEALSGELTGVDLAMCVIEELEKKYSEGEKSGYRKQSGWISVDDPDKKPRHLQECFIAYVFGDSERVFYGTANFHAFEGNGLVEGPHFSNEGVEEMRVKYWMPIPKPPKVKGGE